VHMQAEHLESYALGELPKELSGVIESHLKTCVTCGIQFEESRAAIGRWAPVEKPIDQGDKRHRLRFATDDPAVLTVLKPEQPGRTKIKVVDASKDGLKLLVPYQLIAGMLIQLYVRDLFIMGEVRHCIAAGAAFHAGIQIQDVFPACG
jgi:hypothetical protein